MAQDKSDEVQSGPSNPLLEALGIDKSDENGLSDGVTVKDPLQVRLEAGDAAAGLQSPPVVAQRLDRPNNPGAQGVRCRGKEDGPPDGLVQYGTG